MSTPRGEAGGYATLIVKQLKLFLKCEQSFNSLALSFKLKV